MADVKIVRTAVAEQRRMRHVGELFGVKFALKVEPYVYAIAGMLAESYKGGYWEFYSLTDPANQDHQGFYMAPMLDVKFEVSCPNQFIGTLSNDALGVVACLYTYSNLSFSKDDKLSAQCAQQYHYLRSYALQHAEVEAIMRAID